MADMKVVGEVTVDTSKAVKSTDELSNSVNKLTGQVSTSSIAIGTLASNIVSNVGGKIVSAFQSASNVAKDYQTSLTTLGILSNVFGQDTKQVQDAAQSLGIELKIGPLAAADSLGKLLKSGLNLDQATTLLKRFTNEALTGKASTMTLSTAVSNLSEMYQTEVSALGNYSGISENVQFLLKKEADLRGVDINKLDEQGKAQLKYDAYIRLTNQTLGSSQQFAGTLVSTQNQWDQSIQQTSKSLGEILNPLINDLEKQIIPVINSIGDWIGKNKDAVVYTMVFTTSIVTLVGASVLFVKGIGLAIKALEAYRAMTSLAQLSTGLLGIAILGVSLLLADQVTKQLNSGKATEDNTKKIADLRDQMIALEKAGTQTNTQATKQQKDLAEKIQQTTQAIKDENQAYEDQVAQIIMSREKDLADSKAALDKQTADFNKQQAANLKTYNKKIDDQKKQNQSHLDNLAQTLGQELIVGSSTYEQDTLNYQQALNDQKAANDQALQDIIDQHNSDTQDAQSNYADQTKTLQDKIVEDEAFLKKHAEVVKGINRDVNKDELDQLDETHQKRLDSLNRELKKEQDSADESNTYVANSNQAAIDEIQKQIDSLTGINLNDLITPLDFKALFAPLPGEIWKFFRALNASVLISIVELAKTVAKLIDSTFSNIPGVGDFFKQDAKSIDNNAVGLENGIARTFGFKDLQDIHVPGFASGTDNFSGGMAWVGEEGPELVNLPHGSTVHNASDSKAMASAGNVYNFNVNAGSHDGESLGRQLFFTIRALT